MSTSDNYCFLIADDHSVVRQGLCLLIKELYANAKIYHAGTLKDTLEVLKETRVDLLILDINFPDGNSINSLEELKSIQKDLKILIFTMNDEDIYGMRYLNGGASGYLSKASCEDEMKEALSRMMIFGKYLTSNLKSKISDHFISNKPINPLDQLSAREVEVAKLLIKGYGNLEITNLLQIKNTTVSTFKKRIFEKLEIDNVAALIELFQLYFEDKNLA
ncbi:response regulator transcription factor [Flavobacterium aestivum]|uniref:response regulator transcription factor n=1 Tax=Flavobacterium aestivum TaxID=3003257 RepID=UPI002482B7FC|nr:response regulator transcription factor [Flavobacterium aestivum]